jgi:signal peptidase I
MGNKSRTVKTSRRNVCDWFEILVGVISAAIIIMVFFGRINHVFGSSMYPTLMEGEVLIVTPLYGMPKHGDIVIVYAENLPNSITEKMGEPIVKRVIGLPGDEIYISRESGEVFRNGEKLEELYISEKIAPDKVGNRIYPLKVEVGQVFVLGDNRNFSIDSRVAAGSDAIFYVGCVDTGYIIGRAVFRIFPFNVFGGVN